MILDLISIVVHFSFKKVFLPDLMHLTSLSLSTNVSPFFLQKSSRAQCSFSTCINDINDPRFTGNSIGNRRFGVAHTKLNKIKIFYSFSINYKENIHILFICEGSASYERSRIATALIWLSSL